MNLASRVVVVVVVVVVAVLPVALVATAFLASDPVLESLLDLFCTVAGTLLASVLGSAHDCLTKGSLQNSTIPCL